MWTRLIIGAALGLVAGIVSAYAVRTRGGAGRSRLLPLLLAPLGLAAGLAVAAVTAPKASADTAAYDALPVIVDPNEFDRQVLGSDRPVLVDFYATWCEPCRDLAPIIGRLTRQYDGKVRFFRVDFDQSLKLVKKYGVRGLPTVIVFAPAREPQTLLGVQDESEYTQVLDRMITSERPGATSTSRPLGSRASSEPSGPSTGKEAKMAVTATSRTVTMHGNPVELVGNEIKVGSKAPDFVAVSNDMKEVRLSDIKADVVVLSAVPSLDTAVCDTETRRFNQEAAKLPGDVKVITVSMDLPFAQKRWCAAAGVKNVQTLSDWRYVSFGSAYGVVMKDIRLLARCVFVLDRDRRVTYVQLVPEVSQEPDYPAVIDAVRKLTGK